LEPSSLISIIFSSSIAFILLAVFAIAIIRHRRFQKRQELHGRLAADMGLKFTFQYPHQYRVYGNYKGYPISVFPIELLRESKDKVKYASKISIPMVNPNRKSIRIHPKGSELAQLIPIDQALKVKHPAQSWLSIDTNDFLFSSLILSDDIKISLGAFFQSLGKGIVYIQDDELACILPGLLQAEDQIAHYVSALDLLCEIKDELN